MRITSQILTRTSLETGIPIAQNGILDAMNNQSTPVDLLDALEQKQKAEKNASVQKNYRELENAADDLGRHASNLLKDGGDSLFGKAAEQKDTEDILTEITDMIESYNKTLELLQNADGSLNYFYYKELKNTATDNMDLLKSVGITQTKDGSLSVDDKLLSGTDYDTLKKVFGNESDFMEKSEYISGKAAENAAAGIASVSNQYNAKGVTYNDSFEANKYNFFG